MKHHTPTFTMRDPMELRGHIHPALKSIPELAEDSPEFLAIAAGVGQVGVIQPLLIDDQGRILDDHSRTALRCALRWQIKSVPVQVTAEENIDLIIIHSLAHRRHLSKSAIAYLAVPHLAPAFEIARQRRLKQIKDNSVVSSGDFFKTVEEMGEVLGLGRNLLFEAQRVHTAFADKKIYTFNVCGGKRDGEIVECTLKAWFEPKLLQPFIGGEHESNRPLGLGGILAGIASIKEGNRGKFDPKQANQLELFNRGFDQFIGRALKLDHGTISKNIRDWFSAGNLSDEDADRLEQIGETIKAEARARRKGASRTGHSTANA
jgi:hypothetical protein